MKRIKFDIDVLMYLSTFEKITRVAAKDCFVNKTTIYFIVQESDIGKAIGKKASNLKILEKKLPFKVRVIGYASEAQDFLSNIIYPIKVKDIEKREKVLIITPQDTKSRGVLIGPSATKLRIIEKILKRHFDIEEVKIGQPDRN